MPIWMRRLARRARALARGGALDRELDEEIRFHLELEAADLARTRGFPADEARRQALIAFGGEARAREAHRDARGVRWLEDLARDVRYAARALRRTPGFALSAALVLALGVGAGTAAFRAAHAVFLARLPYPHGERLVRIYQQNSPTNRWTLSAVDFRAIEAKQRTLAAVGALLGGQLPVSSGVDAERVRTGRVTAGFFRALGVRAARGRDLEPADERIGAAPVALVTHAFAARTFGGDAAAVGKALTVDGTPHTVIGVLPPEVRDLAGMRAEVWPVLQLPEPQRRGPFGMVVVARLADGVTLDAARRDLARISAEIFPVWAASFQDSSARLTPVPLREAMLGRAGETLGMFAAAVALVLLIAVANVASLTLVRATGRARELTLRMALGATRARLVRLLVTESLVLALTGALLGLAFGALALRVFAAVGPPLPSFAQAQLDLRAAGFALTLALASAAVVGAYPVVMLMRRGGAGVPGADDRTAGAGRGTQAVRGAFVVAQLALALPLLAGAGLLLNSFLRLQRVEPGFDARHLLAVRVPLPSARYGNDTTIGGFWARALPRVRELPGVTAAGLGDAMPPYDPGMNINNFDLADRPVPAGTAQPLSPWVGVGGEYFAALGMRLLEGRRFGPGDSAQAPPVVVVSRSWAQHYFPAGDAVGRRLVSGGCTTCPLTTVIGVVSDVRYQGLSGTPEAVYYPLTQQWEPTLNLFVRTAAPPAQAIAGVRAALRSVEPGVPLDDAAPMAERVAESVAQPRHWTAILGGFAAAALGLAAVGVFGMLSYTVSARRREIGVRMALGARRRDVIGMVVRRGMGHALAGAAIGLAAAAGGARWLESALFEVRTTDPPTLAAVTLLLLAVALVASWLPARRAASIDPMEAIRVE